MYWLVAESNVSVEMSVWSILYAVVYTGCAEAAGNQRVCQCIACDSRRRPGIPSVAASVDLVSASSGLRVSFSGSSASPSPSPSPSPLSASPSSEVTYYYFTTCSTEGSTMRPHTDTGEPFPTSGVSCQLDIIIWIKTINTTNSCSSSLSNLHLSNFIMFMLC